MTAIVPMYHQLTRHGEGEQRLPSSDLFFSRHARNRMRRYRQTLELTENDVAAALDRPEVILPSIRGRSNAWKNFGDFWLRVTFIEQAHRRVVVIVTVKRQGPSEEADDEDDV
jgi:hypothetical protein